MIGAQRPRVFSAPEFDSSLGQEAIELASHAGLELDEWQQLALIHAMGLRADGLWSAFEVGVSAPRQNGKDGIAEARELAGIFLVGEQLITHTAHLFDTSLEHMLRVEQLLAGQPDLSRRVRKINRSHGQEGIKFKSGQRIRFRTRTKKGGRGFSGDLVVFNEAMELSEASIGALMPSLSARQNPQLWYMGSAVDQQIHEQGVAFARIRNRGLKGDDPSLAYLEWSIDADAPDAVTNEVASDPEAWAQANPALGIRITVDYLEKEQRSMNARTFAVERLGVGDWPTTDTDAETKIDREDWDKLCDMSSSAPDPVCFAFDVTPDRSAAAIGVAGRRADGKVHDEVVDHRGGTGWVAPRLDGLLQKHDALGVVVDASGPAGSIIPELEALGYSVSSATAKDRGDIVVVGAREHTQACGIFYDLVDRRAIRHLGSAELSNAIAGAASRSLGDAWAWARKSSLVDISPLVAVTLATWGLSALKKPGSSKPPFDLSDYRIEKL